MSVRVYILTEISKERSKVLEKALFTDPRFEVIIPDWTYLPDSTNNLELIKVMNILINSNKEAPEKPILIIKDNSTANIDSKSLIRIIESVNLEYDLFYLCRWQDKCDLNDQMMTLENKLIKIMSTYYAQGLQALMISTKGRDKLMGSLKSEDTRDVSDILLDKINRAELEAICSIPNVIDFDISLAKNILDETYKTVMCSMDKNTTKNIKSTELTTNENSDYTILAIIFIVVILILLLFR